MRAVEASDAPVPPFITAKSVPDQLPSLIDEAVANEPKPKDVLAVAPDSATQVVPLPTMIFPSVAVKAAIEVNCAL